MKLKVFFIILLFIPTFSENFQKTKVDVKSNSQFKITGSLSNSLASKRIDSLEDEIKNLKSSTKADDFSKELSAHIISIASILVALILTIIGGTYAISVLSFKRELKKAKYGLKKIKNDQTEFVEHNSKELEILKNRLEKSKNIFNNINKALTIISKDIRNSELEKIISSLEDKMSNVDFRTAYEKVYLDAINSSESIEVLRSTLLAIKSMGVKKAIPNIDILLSAKIAPRQILELAKDVKDYLLKLPV
jgi:hypothetical protein